jgi:hypothetical protein
MNRFEGTGSSPAMAPSRCEAGLGVQNSAQKNDKAIASERRMRITGSLLGVLSLTICMGIAQAADKMSRPARQIHNPILLNGATLQQARWAILTGMNYNKGVKLTYEGETPNSVLARWDYRGGVVLFEVRYDEQQIQVLYKDASEEYQCLRLRAGVCQSGTHRYYNYIPNFTKAIRTQLARLGRTK